MIRVHAAQPSDRALLNHLLQTSAKTHTHLDWHAPHSWLGKKPFYIAFNGETAIAALAAPPDPAETSWIRLATLSEENKLRAAFDPIWMPTLKTLRESKVKLVACMLLDEWFVPQLKTWGFQQSNDVVVLSRPMCAPPRAASRSLPKGLTIRPARSTDFHALTIADAAFTSPWHYSPDTIRQAMTQVEFSSVAELNGEIIGYQFSSGGQRGGHLARLAVKPQYQNQGIGRALMIDITQHFDRLGAPQMTVNTQHDNLSSLALYRAFGFELTSEHYPVWQLII